MNTAQSKGYSPTPKFLSIKDLVMKEMMDYILEQKQLRADQLAIVGKLNKAASFALPEYGIVFTVIEKLVQYADENEAICDQFMERKIDRAVLKSAVNSMKSEISAIKTRIELMKNNDTPFDDRKLEVPSAFHSCEKLLSDFENKDHVFYQHPLISTPSLIALSHLYVSICTYGVELLPAYTEIAEQEKERLREVLRAYKLNTVKERLGMVKITQTITMPYYDGKIKDEMTQLARAGSFKNALSNLKKKTKSLKFHEVDIVKDGFGFESKSNELHYWDRTLWEHQQKVAHNYDYSTIVRNAYEDYFDKIIDATF
ncbi:7205_t:CDS:1 [Ambispora gerdemannii]|uniref:7205_t:CDS:1 n=1 Tax=Ambispora gerdemannii TaxID=144530 RepID=A0A9N9DVD3_9GLOM|nr:7205_t:CDS:1 [Ambispora gerdemannii]